jgi:2-iminoacetate synthase ThiH
MRGLLTELVKLRFEEAYQRLWRVGLVAIVEKMSTELLDEVRIAMTEELARRGIHVITHRSWKMKVA